MKSIYITAFTLAFAGSLWAADSSAFKDKKDRASYALGMNIGKSFHQSDLDLNLDQLMQGIRTGMAGGTNALLTESEQQEAVKTLQQEVRLKQEEKRKVEGEKNKTEGEAFLAENGKKPGVITLPSGLQYKVITEGAGPTPKSSDQVKCNYRGTLINGTEFDSSYKRGQPSTFRVTGVIKGWTEALQQMKVGSKWQLYIPSNLAYGERGSGANIGPNAALLFEIELIEIVPPVQPAPTTNAPVTSDIIKVPSAEEMKRGAKIEVIKPGSTNFPPTPDTTKPLPAKK